MKKYLAVILSAALAVSSTGINVLAADNEAAASGGIVEYVYDFDNQGAEAYTTTGTTNYDSIGVETDTVSGSKALKFVMGTTDAEVVRYMDATIALPAETNTDIVEISYDIRIESEDNAVTASAKRLSEFPGVYSGSDKQLLRYATTNTPWFNVTYGGNLTSSSSMKDKYWNVKSILNMNEKTFDYEMPGTVHGDKTGTANLINTDSSSVKKLVFKLEDYKSYNSTTKNVNTVVWIDNIVVKAYDIEAVSVKPTNNADEVGIGSDFRIKYNAKVTDNFIKNSAITVKAGSAELTEDTDYTVSADNDTLVIGFNENLLFGTKYTVTVAGEEYCFTTKEETSEYITTYDFEDGDIGVIEELVKNPSDSISIETEANGNKALKLVKASTGSTAPNMSFKLDAFTIGERVEVSYKMKVESATQSDYVRQLPSFPSFNDADGNKIFYYNSAELAFFNAYAPASTRLGAMSAMSAWTTVKSVIKNTDGNKSFDYEVTALNASGTDKTYVNTAAGNLDKLYFEMRDTTTASTTAPYTTVIWIDDIMIKDTVGAGKLVEMIPANGEDNVRLSTRDVVMNWSGEITDSVLSNMALTVKKGADTLAENTDYTVEADGGKLTISFANDLDFGTVYTITAGGKDYSFTSMERKSQYVTEYNFNDGDISVIENLVNGANDSVTIENGALKIVKGKVENGNSVMSFNIDAWTIGKEVELSYDIKVEDTANPGAYTGEIKATPELRDADGNPILKFTLDAAQHLRLYHSVNAATWQYVQLANIENTTQFDKTEFYTLKTTIQNGGNSFSYDAMGQTGTEEFMVSSAGKLNTLFFDFRNSAATDQTIIWIDNIKIVDKLDDVVVPAITVNTVTADGNTVLDIAAAAGKTITIDADVNVDGAKLIAAVYEGGKLLGVCTQDTLTLEVPAGAAASTHEIRLFAWDIISGMSPATASISAF